MPRNFLLCAGLCILAIPSPAPGQSIYSTPYTFTTLAGNAGSGTADGTGGSARFYQPLGVAVDHAGNLYVGDTQNHTIRHVTPAGIVTTLAGLPGSSGTNDGTGSAARFYSPQGTAVDGAGNVYVADSLNYTIRKVTPAGVVTTLAGLAGSSGSVDDTGSSARFKLPVAVAVDGAGNVFVADEYNDTIRKVTPAGVVTTLAGMAGSSGTNNGTGSGARFYNPRGVAVDGASNVFVSDYLNQTIRKVTSSGVVSTLAGLAGSSGTNDGTGSAARFYQPQGLMVDGAGNLYVAEQLNHTLRKITPAGAVTTLAGLPGHSGTMDGAGSVAQFNSPDGVAVDAATNVYVADANNNTIRKVTPAGVVTTLSGLAGGPDNLDGTGSAARFGNPADAAVDGAGNVYVTDQLENTIRKVSPSGAVTTLAGLAGSPGTNDGTGAAARFSYPIGVALDSATNVYVADADNNTIRKITPGGVVTTLAGLAGTSGTNDGTGDAARFYHPFGVAVDGAGNVYVADSYNDTIRKVTSSGVVTTLAGSAGNGGSSDGTNSGAQFDQPCGVAVDGAGNIYVADEFNFTIRKVTPAGVVTTPAGFPGNSGTNDGTGSDAQFYYPQGVAVDGASNVYVADTLNFTIRKITPAGAVTTLAGLGGLDGGGDADGTGSAARFNSPQGLAVDGAGNLYVADTYNGTIRKGFPGGSVAAPTLQPPGLNSGQFGFELAGLPALAVDLESSTNFSDWQWLGTFILDGGTNFYLAPTPPQGTRFFRAHVR